MFRRHPVLSALALLVLAAGGLFAYALATFDLDSYRSDLQEHLSAALERPVRLGRADLSFRHGPAVAFSNVEVDDAGKKEFLRADRLLVRLDWRALLQGRLTFSRILLEKPKVLVSLSADEKAPKWPDLRDLESAEIRSLAVEDGTLRFEDRRDPQRPFSAALEGIKAEISGVAAGRAAWVRVGATLRTASGISPLTLAGEVTLPKPSGGKHDGRIKLGLLVERFDPAPLLAHALNKGVPPLSGKGRLELTADGTPSGGLRFDGRFAGAGIAARIPGRKTPLPLREMKGSGTWSRRGDGHAIRELLLKADDLALQGDLSLRGEGENRWVDARFSTPPLPLRSLTRLLPKTPPGLSVQGGTAQLRSGTYLGPASALKDPAAWGAHLSGEIVLAGISGEIPKIGPLTGGGGTVRLKDDLLFLERGSASLLGTSVALAGAVEHPFGTEREILLQAEGAPAAERILPLIPARYLRGLALKGAAPMTVTVEKGKEALKFDFQADLSSVAASWQGDFRKPAGLPARLSVAGDLTPQRLKVDSAALELPSLELLARGTVARSAAEKVSATLELKASDLATSPSLFPPLASWKPRGGIDARAELERIDGKVRYSGAATLRDVGIHITTAIADVREANGVVRFNEEGVEAEGLTGRLGTSPLTADGRLVNYKNPRIELRVRGRAIRADELVFFNPRSTLRDVDGHLVIDSDHVAFTPVEVRLDGGTRAIVRGEVRDFGRPHVSLDIAAEQADINEVIALWEEPPGKPSSPMTPEQANTTVRITARVPQGKLGPLRFQQAAGVITWERGTLSIHPLRFRAGSGTCTGRVVLEEGPDDRSILTVSGHTEGMDAAAIYSELLERRGLVTGKLRGDFFLAGDLEKFQETAHGGVNVEVEKGVLRKFNSLAKIFSLLNVSQILALQLPDMARDGMPFNRLSANFEMNRGSLRTEDLFVDSNAMNLSLVGGLDLKTEKLDLLLGVKPLRTVDKIVTRIPLAGWILTGEEKALITAHFQIRGDADDPEVRAVPITSLSEKAVGIFRRVLGLPGHVVENVGEMVRGN